MQDKKMMVTVKSVNTCPYIGEQDVILEFEGSLLYCFVPDYYTAKYGEFQPNEECEVYFKYWFGGSNWVAS